MCATRPELLANRQEACRSVDAPVRGGDRKYTYSFADLRWELREVFGG